MCKNEFDEKIVESVSYFNHTLDLLPKKAFNKGLELADLTVTLLHCKIFNLSKCW